MDYKEWIHNRAEKLSEEKYNKDFYDLPDHLQTEVYNQAEADYIDHHSAMIDAAYERAREQKWFNKG